jgi:TonB family protein
MTFNAVAADLLALSAQLACVIAVAGLLSLAVRIDRAGLRYQYWRGVLFFCVLIPWLQGRQSAAHVVETTMTRALPPGALLLVSSVDVTARAPGVAWLRVALWIVLSGIALRLAYVGLGLVRLGRLRRSGRVAFVDGHEDIQRVLGTNAEIRYVGAGQPVTWGVWRPVVLLPENLMSQPAEIQRAVVSHELLHVRRRDWTWVVGEELLRAVFWFHPGVWWLVARVRLAREEAVDELTVRVTGERRAYLEALLAFADATPLAPGAAFGRRRYLFRRMTLISKEAVMSSRRVVMSFAVLVFGVVAGSRYVVMAFPLMQAPGVIQPVAQPSTGSEPGPLERTAKAITAENPIPRRTYSVMPRNPANPGAIPLAVTLRITINSLGRVGEVRAWPSQNPAALDAFVKAATDAVRQWIYEPPAEAPVSFNVTFVFAQGFDARVAAYGTPIETDTGGVGFAPPRPPPPPALPWVREGATIGTPVRIGGEIKPPVKTKDVRPWYPADARDAKVQGVVILEVIVGPEGRVDQARVVRSIPQLDQAALDAVEQWEFTPTLLNGSPVPVLLTVTINFTLK